MSSSAVRTAFRSFLASGFTDLPIVDVVNSRTLPSSRPASFVAYEFLPGEEIELTVGGPVRLYEETGTLLLHVFGPAGAGDSAVITAAETLRTLFRAARLLSGALHVESVSPPDTGDGDDDGMVFRATVEVQWARTLSA